MQPIRRILAAECCIVILGMGSFMTGCTRLAPSPTGALHLGNVRTFLVNYLLARQNDWKIILRIEDLDGPRVKTEAAQQAIDDLKWLGIEWDAGPFFQKPDLAIYQRTLLTLAEKGDAYPCRCTRSEIEAASLSAPQQGDHELRYPGTCRPRSPLPAARLASDELERDPSVAFTSAWRLIVPEGRKSFVDEFAGEYSVDTQNTIGDFLIWTKQAVPAYQLAVVVDDHRQGVNCIVRGDDLLSSVPRQRLIAQKLGWIQLADNSNSMRYWHLPLIVGTDGRRLAKRHGDTRLSSYRESEVSVERVLGLMAEWCGVGSRQEISMSELLAGFDISALPRKPIVFQPADDRWLKGLM
jgi:glutamyl-tRNA synthetase